MRPYLSVDAHYFPLCDARYDFASSDRLTLPRALTGNSDKIRNSRGTCQLLSPLRQWLSSNWRETVAEHATYATRSSFRIVEGIPKTTASITPGNFRMCSSTMDG